MTKPNATNKFNLVANAANPQQADLTLMGEIGWWETDGEYFKEVVDQALAAGMKDVRIYISSEGGDVFSANEIVNQIRRFTGKKVAQLGALCASAATFIACACDEIIASTNTMYMIHEPAFGSLRNATIQKLKSCIGLLEGVRATMVTDYAKKTGIAEKEISQMVADETWMTAPQAKAKGFVTSVSDTAAPIHASVNKELLKGYRHTPSNLVQDVQEVTTDSTIFDQNMDKLSALLGLPSNATPEQVEAAIKALQGENATLKANATKEKATALVDREIAAGRLKAESRDKMIAAATADYAAVEATLSAVSAPAAAGTAADKGTEVDPSRLASRNIIPLNNNANTATDGGKEVVWDDLTTDQALFNRLNKENPKLVAKLYKDKFGVEPGQ